jgi:hypothetical protein
MAEARRRRLKLGVRAGIVEAEAVEAEAVEAEAIGRARRIVQKVRAIGRAKARCSGGVGRGRARSTNEIVAIGQRAVGR